MFWAKIISGKKTSGEWGMIDAWRVGSHPGACKLRRPIRNSRIGFKFSGTTARPPIFLALGVVTHGAKTRSGFGSRPIRAASRTRPVGNAFGIYAISTEAVGLMQDGCPIPIKAVRSID